MLTLYSLLRVAYINRLYLKQFTVGIHVQVLANNKYVLGLNVITKTLQRATVFGSVHIFV